MIKTKIIDHVCLWVRSVTKSKTYYENIFGFECSFKTDSKQTLMVESETTHFFLCETNTSHDFISKQHISFEVDKLSDVIENLNKMGISDIDTGEFNLFKYRNYKWCEWRDPSGIRLECIELI